MKNFLQSLGNVTSIIGAQWGDEGKGKAVDILAEHYDIIARACGGANAGHTIVVQGTKHIFHLLPSGCLHDGKQIVLGAGLVIHLPTLLEEIATLKEHGIDILPRLHISPEAHILFDFHKDIDSAMENARSKSEGEGIGTTKRGIGPAYMDKAARIGIRMEKLNDNLEELLQHHAAFLEKAFDVSVDIEKEKRNITEASSLLSPCITDTISYLHTALHEEKTILIEGAQATLLDIDHGTYPYVTSSATTITGALQALGLPPSALHSCIGVAKAYCTRVGGGIFKTEAEEEDAKRLRERGGEYGATTGRPRRCGWLSIDDLKFAARINGYTHWNITKLDVLDDEAEIPVYMNGSYTKCPGWQSSTAGMKRYEDLPENAKKYIEMIERETGVPVSLIGTGQEREEMIVRT